MQTTILTLLVAALLVAAVPWRALGSETLDGEEKPWAALEQSLIDAGIGVDTRSLIAVAASERDSGVRWEAIEVLGLRGESEAKETLLRLVSVEEDRLLRETAALALARLGDERGLAALRDFAHTTPTVQRQLFLAARLAEQGDASGYPQVVQATASDDPYERFLSVAALVPFVRLQMQSADGERLDPEPLQRLVALAEDSDPKVRYEVLVQLSIAVARGAPLERVEPIVQRMAQEDASREVREKADALITAWRFAAERSERPAGESEGGR